MLKERLELLNLPPLFKAGTPDRLTGRQWEERRADIYAAVCEYEFGWMPATPPEVRGTVLNSDKFAYCGKATEQRIELSFDTPSGEFKFPLYLLTPNIFEKHPVFVHIAFRPETPDRYVPCEEIIDRGYTLAMFCYNDITADANDDFTSGIATMYGERRKTSWSKIGMWAFAASRVVDYLVTLPETDCANIAVMGHSRLGKTALWAGASDIRFKYVISNDSGCAGAALARESIHHSDAEHVDRIASAFPVWFSGDYAEYANREDEMPYDQHWLLALTAPRYLYVASASLDKWACPESEYLACAAASEAWERQELDGFIAYDKFPRENFTFHEGCVGYHLRPGRHFLSRYDWNKYMDFIDRKTGR